MVWAHYTVPCALLQLACVVRLPFHSADHTTEDILDALTSLLLWPELSLGHSGDYYLELLVPLCNCVSNIASSL